MELKKINEKTILETPVFNVVRKFFAEEDGSPFAFQPVGIKCPDWVMAIVLDRQNKTIVVRQTRWGEEGKMIEFPCGTVEEGEKPVDAALRELKEETGFDMPSNKVQIHEIACFNPNSAYFSNRMHVFAFIIDTMPELGAQSLDENEDCIATVCRLDYAVMQEIMKGAIGAAAIGHLAMAHLINF